MTIQALVGPIAGLALFGLIGLYLYSFYKFHQLVRTERPDWVDRKGSLSFFYDGLPRAFDPNVTVAVLRIALSGRVKELQSPLAATYAWRIRFLLVFVIAVFLLLLAIEGIGAA